MNKRLVAAAAMMAVFVTSSAAATAYQRSITASYDIKLEINGNNTELTDANGKKVEPFTYNGTTYVPIRAVAENMGSYVGYDANTKTAIVYQDDKEAIVMAHKISEESQQIASVFDGLYSTCSLRGNGALSVTEAMSGLQIIADNADECMNEVENMYNILKDNDNIYLDDINECMSALRYEYQTAATAMTNAVSYVNSPSQSVLSRILDGKTVIAVRKSAQSYANDFIDSMWSYE